MITSLYLYRYDRGVDNTHGLMYVEGRYFCDSLELPWKDNQHNISSVPTGIYDLKLEYSLKLKQNVYRFNQVDGREGILIHSANLVSQLEGCIALGVKNAESVIDSRETMRKFVERVGDQAILKVVNI